MGIQILSLKPVGRVTTCHSHCGRCGFTSSLCSYELTSGRYKGAHRLVHVSARRDGVVSPNPSKSNPNQQHHAVGM